MDAVVDRTSVALFFVAVGVGRGDDVRQGRLAVRTDLPGPARLPDLADALEATLIDYLLYVVGHELHALADVVLVFFDLVRGFFEDLTDRGRGR